MLCHLRPDAMVLYLDYLFSCINLLLQASESLLSKVAHFREECAASIADFNFNKKRVKVVSDVKDMPEENEGILYWMMRDQRVQGKLSYLAYLIYSDCEEAVNCSHSSQLCQTYLITRPGKISVWILVSVKEGAWDTRIDRYRNSWLWKSKVLVKK